ncbi:unnamed protein product [Choristocarpus tenellus]
MSGSTAMIHLNYLGMDRREQSENLEPGAALSGLPVINDSNSSPRPQQSDRDEHMRQVMSDPPERCWRELDGGHLEGSLPDAALVARGGIKSGYLWKMGTNVQRWKRRYFVLKPITMLFYYLSENDTKPRGCIDLDIFDSLRKVGNGLGEVKGEGTGGTRFELSSQRCPEGDGFLLEARGEKEWEEWVEAIASSRHGKMRAECDVVKSANKLLSGEVASLEKEVKDLREYASQRHRTALNLRKEQQKCEKLSGDILSLAEFAGSLSDTLKSEREGGNSKFGFRCSDSEVVDRSSCSDRSGCGLTSNANANEGASSMEGAPGPTSTERSESIDQVESDFHDYDDATIECRVGTIREALEAMETELGYRLKAAQAEALARSRAEARAAAAEEKARAVEDRARVLEATCARDRGRASVLESHVKHLQAQQQQLGAEVSMLKQTKKLARAHKAVLVKELRAMRLKEKSCQGAQPLGPSHRRNSTSTLLLAAQPGSVTQARGIGSTSCRRGRAESGLSRPSSLISLATSDGGETDVAADQNFYESSSDEFEPREEQRKMETLGNDPIVDFQGSPMVDGEGSGCNGYLSHDSTSFQFLLRASIRRRVGSPKEILQQGKPSTAMSLLMPQPISANCQPFQPGVRADTSKEWQQPQGVSGVQQSSSPVIRYSTPPLRGGRGSGSVAGKLFTGLGMGMMEKAVEKAAQEVGRLVWAVPGPGDGDASSSGTLASLPALAGVEGREEVVASHSTLLSPPSRTPLLQLADLELMPDEGGREGERGKGSEWSSASSMSNEAVGKGRSNHLFSTMQIGNIGDTGSHIEETGTWEELELEFTSQKIGLQFTASVEGQVVVMGLDGYAGPTTGKRPKVGDILVSYAGESALGKTYSQVAKALGKCGRPLRLGFRGWVEGSGEVKALGNEQTSWPLTDVSAQRLLASGVACAGQDQASEGWGTATEDDCESERVKEQVVGDSLHRVGALLCEG